MYQVRACPYFATCMLDEFKFYGTLRILKPEFSYKVALPGIFCCPYEIMKWAFTLYNATLLTKNVNHEACENV